MTELATINGAAVALPATTDGEVTYLDPTGGRLVAWANAARAANQLATALSGTAFVPQHFRGNPGDTTAALLMGDELGLPPLAALRALYVVHGTPALYARSMVALVQSRGHEVWTEKSTDTEVVVLGRRRGGANVERSAWTIARAQKAGYTSNKKYTTNPQEMLWAKAASEACKKIAADVLAAVPSTVEDLELDQPVATTTVTRDAEAKPTRVARKKADPPPAAEPEFDAHPEPVDDEPMITDAQMKKMQATFTEKGFKDRDDRLGFVALTLDRDVASSKDLTRVEAGRVIEALDALADPEEAGQ